MRQNTYFVALLFEWYLVLIAVLFIYLYLYGFDGPDVCVLYLQQNRIYFIYHLIHQMCTCAEVIYDTLPYMYNLEIDINRIFYLLDEKPNEKFSA